jgi:aldehyde dehydrogenase (NAD+)
MRQRRTRLWMAEPAGLPDRNRRPHVEATERQSYPLGELTDIREEGMDQMRLVIGEEQSAGASDRWVDVINPATEERHARVPIAESSDVDRAVLTARQAYDHGPWRKMMPNERGRLLYRLAELIEAHTDELALFDTQDMGKPYTHAREHDVPAAVEFLRFYAGFCDKIRGSQIPCGPGKHVYVVREPVGVVAGILPWNFPLVIAIQKLGPALACGNTLVLKPAEQSPRSALRLAELCLEAGIPPGVVNAITGPGEITGAALASHPAVDKISFTGSTGVGQLIMRAAADQIKKVTLELGGKTANIIFDDADMAAATTSTILTSCYNSGQICTTGSRLVVHRKVHDTFLATLVEKMDALRIGDPMHPATKLGPLVSRDQYDRVNRYIAIGKEHYNPIVCGVRDKGLDRGFYVNPTVFDHVDAQSRIAQEEIFGPVLSVIPFDDEDQAARIANQTSFGLATAIWTDDLRRAHRLATRVDSGFVWINCNNYWVSSIPYEGHRRSGIGADMGIEAAESYTRLKSVVVDLERTPHPWAGA